MLASLDEADLFASSFSNAVFGLEAIDLCLEFAVDSFQLIKLDLALGQADILVHPGLDGENKYCGRDGGADNQNEEATEESNLRATKDPLLHRDRPCEVAQARAAFV